MGLVKDLFKGDRVIWIIFLFLCLISIIEVFSAGSSLTYKSGDHWAPIRQHSVFLIVGFVIVVLVHNIPSKWFKALPFFLLPLSIILLLFVMAMGFIHPEYKTNDAARWLNVAGIQFQPSEIAKMAIIIITAFILSRTQEEKSANPKAFKYIMWCLGIVFVLIAPENGSTAALLAGVVFLMMIIGRVPWKLLIRLAAIVIAAVIFFVAFLKITPDTTLSNIPLGHRFVTWKHRIFSSNGQEAIPAAKFDINGESQKAHAHIAIASSNIIGKMPGNSVERDFLPQAFSDFIFAIIIEELGLLGGGFVVILYIWLLIRAGRIANKCEKTFPAFLVLGITLLLVSQAMLNMMVAVDLFPITGQPLPLISKGGTSTLINCAYIGMILSVSREVNEREAELVEEEKQNAQKEKAKDLLNMAMNMAEEEPEDELDQLTEDLEYEEEQ